MKIRKHFPEPKPQKVLTQGYVSVTLWILANAKRKKLNLTWNELMDILLKAFLEEQER